jgi:pimeloyl-ACP methyl ester carboxylesterase
VIFYPITPASCCSYHEILVPTLEILVTDRDWHPLRQSSRRLAAVVAVRGHDSLIAACLVFDQSGHSPAADEPALFQKAVRDFLVRAYL